MKFTIKIFYYTFIIFQPFYIAKYERIVKIIKKY